MNHPFHVFHNVQGLEVGKVFFFLGFFFFLDIGHSIVIIRAGSVVRVVKNQEESLNVIGTLKKIPVISLPSRSYQVNDDDYGWR